jgi:hypothetical protein
MNDRITGSHDQITAGDAPRPPQPQGITDAPKPAAPAQPAPSGKGLQWGIAVALAAVLVFGAVFAMNYLPYLNWRSNEEPQDDPEMRRTLTFLSPLGRSPLHPIEGEVGAAQTFDFWFVNDHDGPMVIGLKKKNCKCTSVEAFILPEQRRQASLAAALVAAAPSGPLALGCALRFGECQPWPDLHGTELLHKEDTLEVPAHAAGWVRAFWKGERAGTSDLGAAVWMNDPDKGPTVGLMLPVLHFEPLRVAPVTAVGTLKEEELGEGVTRYVLVWSSTRPAFALEARAATTHGSADADPFEVGAPKPLSESELSALRQQHSNPHVQPPELYGPVLAGYKVPVTIRAFSRNGKVPFDVGAFSRAVLLSSPDVAGEPKRVLVRGRIAGLVDIPGDEGAGEVVNFGPFPRREGGAATPLTLTSTVPGLRLEVDRKRTPDFLEATLEGPKVVDDSTRGWTLRASVLPGKVSGTFPRAEDPLYEDSAIYLIARVPLRLPPWLRRSLDPRAVARFDEATARPRPIRIAARGMANEN